jgi:hypothetical protein
MPLPPPQQAYGPSSSGPNLAHSGAASPPHPVPGSPGHPGAIGNLLNSPSVSSASQQQQASGVPAAAAVTASPIPPSASAVENGHGQPHQGSHGGGRTNSLKRPRSPSTERSPRQQARSPPYAYRTSGASAAAAAATSA